MRTKVLLTAASFLLSAVAVVAQSGNTSQSASPMQSGNSAQSGTQPAAEQPQPGQSPEPQAATAPSQQSPSANSATTPANDGTPMQGSSDSAALQSRINDALRNEPTLGASHVTATVTNSGIDLSGTVGSTKDKQTAERIASSFDGNRKLKDNIVITGAGHSDLAPNHPAMNNSGTGETPNPATNPKSNPH